MKLYELESSQIDKNLKGVANNISNASPMDSKIPNKPEDAHKNMGLQDEPEKPKNVDDALVSDVEAHPYVQNYHHNKSSKIHPYKILQLGLNELYSLRTLVRNQINMKSLSDKHGLYDDPGMKFYQDLISFVEKVISFKKQSGKVNDERPTPKANDKQKPAKFTKNAGRK